MWPFVGGRFIHPLVPLLTLALICGLEMLAAQGLRICFGHHCTIAQQARRVVLNLLTLLVILYLGRDIQMILNPLAARTTNLTAGADYIKRNAPEDAIVMVPHPMA